MKKQTIPTLGALAVATVLALTGCGGGTTDDAGATTSDAAAAAATTGTGKVTVSEQWIKAADGMTSLFGTVTNDTDEDRTIVKAASDEAGMVQLHETVSTDSGGTTMQQKKGGFPLPAHQSKVLEPGGDHVMLMDLKKKLRAGDTVEVTLTLDDGTTVDVDAPVKAFSGAQESYAPTGDTSSSGQ